MRGTSCLSKSKVSTPKSQISAASLLHVLRGVAVATKAHADLVQELTERIQEQAAQFSGSTSRSSSESPERVPADSHGVKRLVRRYGAWHQDLVSGFVTDDDELRQLAKLTLGVTVLRDQSLRGTTTPASVSLDDIWSLVYDALTGAQGNRLHFTASRSAQGFLAVPLCSLIKEGCIDELIRFHVWLPDGQRGVPEVAIHAHQPFAQSWILAGYGADYTFAAERTDDPASATHAEYVPRWSDGKQATATYKTHQVSSTVTCTGQLVRVSPISSEKHTRDMTYTVPSGLHHQTVVPPGRLHATLFFFDSNRGFLKDATVLGPIDGKDFTQLRDPAGMTPSVLARMAQATRSWEQSRGLYSVDDEELGPVMEIYRQYSDHALHKDEPIRTMPLRS